MRTLLCFGLGGVLTTVCIQAFKLSTFNGVFAIICSLAIVIAAVYFTLKDQGDE